MGRRDGNGAWLGWRRAGRVEGGGRSCGCAGRRGLRCLALLLLVVVFRGSLRCYAICLCSCGLRIDGSIGVYWDWRHCVLSVGWVRSYDGLMWC